MSQPKKQYIVRKYILARSAAEALKIENKFKADEVWLSEQQPEESNTQPIGFKAK
jgi:hypothetical protein